MRTKLSTWALIALFAVGCSSSTPPEDKPSRAQTEGKTKSLPTPNPNLVPIASNDGSFIISVPKGWVRVSSKEPKFAEAMKKAGKSSQLKSIDATASQPYFKLSVMDVQGILAKKEFVDNLNVVQLPAYGNKTESDMKLLADATARPVFGSNPYKTTVIDTPYGKVGKYSGATSLGTGSKHDLIGGVFVRDSQVFTVTLSMSAGHGKNMDKTFDDIMSSIDFK